MQTVRNNRHITDEHDDHFHANTVKELIRASDCQFVLPVSCIAKADSLGMPENRRVIARPGVPFSLKGLEVEPIRARHGHIKNSVYKGANMEDCGYILTMGEKRIYQPGDTVLLHEHLELKGIDVLFVSPTEHNTHIVNSAIMIQAIEPTYIFPQHFNTYPVDDENYFWNLSLLIIEEYLLRTLHTREQKWWEPTSRISCS